MSGPGSILVVDDESSVRRVCERTLNQMGFDVQSAANGEAALERLSARPFDFVLTDLSMPESIDGEMLAGEIKHKWPATDVVIMTAFPSLETAIPTLKQGACDYLIKPFSQEVLRSVVARCFEKRRLKEELSREKTLRQELEAAYGELQKVERLKEAIMARVSHELRTPLCSGFMALEALESSSDDSRVSGPCKIIRSSLARLQGTLEDLILSASLSSANISLKRSGVNLRELVEGTVQRYKSLWSERRITVEVEWDENREGFSADADRLGIAFKHLFLNAIYFNKKGGHILIQGARRPECACISFTDSGIGIPREKLPRLFDGFYQAAEWLTRDVGGMGLGLAIVRRIAEAHGGSVVVESVEGRGSVFTLRLPVEAAENI